MAECLLSILRWDCFLFFLIATRILWRHCRYLKTRRLSILKTKFPHAEMEKAIISTIGTLDKPMGPAGRGYTSFMRDFAGITDNMRQQFRDNVLSATPRMLKDVLSDYFSKAAESAAVAVYSAPEKLNEANKHLEEKLQIENIFET